MNTLIGAKKQALVGCAEVVTKKHKSDEIRSKYDVGLLCSAA